MDRPSSSLRKIWAETPPDDDGYPPVGAEGMWAYALETPGRFLLDSIPLFADELAAGDEVEAIHRDERMWIVRLVRPGDHSTLRALMEDMDNTELITQFRDQIRAVGCESEWDKSRGIIAIDAPNKVAYHGVVKLLQAGEDADQWVYWEGAVRGVEPDESGNTAS